MFSAKHGALAVQYAETAVLLIDKDVREVVAPETFPAAQLEEAQRFLSEAKGGSCEEEGPVKEHRRPRNKGWGSIQLSTSHIEQFGQ
jgi:hypothetical protein